MDVVFGMVDLEKVDWAALPTEWVDEYLKMKREVEEECEKRVMTRLVLKRKAEEAELKERIERARKTKMEHEAEKQQVYLRLAISAKNMGMPNVAKEHMKNAGFDVDELNSSSSPELPRAKSPRS